MWALVAAAWEDLRDLALPPSFTNLHCCAEAPDTPLTGRVAYAEYVRKLRGQAVFRACGTVMHTLIMHSHAVRRP